MKSNEIEEAQYNESNFPYNLISCYVCFKKLNVYHGMYLAANMGSY